MVEIMMEDRKKQQSAGVLSIILALVLTLVNSFLALSNALLRNRVEGGRDLIAGEMIGSIIAPILVGLVVVALFQFAQKYRNSRSRWKIYCWTLLVLFVVSVSQLFQILTQAGLLDTQ